MSAIRDRNAKDIKPGQSLERVVDGKATYVGHKYIVKRYDWQTGGDGEDLIADGGFINELLSPERAKEFVIVEG